MGVTFWPWYPLVRTVAEAPGRLGVLQVRAEALLSFPRGKSAMVLYTATAVDEPLVAFVAGRSATLCWRLVRFAEAALPEAESRTAPAAVHGTVQRPATRQRTGMTVGVNSIGTCA
jgi:hypothetical protein